MDANTPGWRLGKRRPYLHYFVDGVSLCHHKYHTDRPPMLDWYEDDRACVVCQDAVLRRGLPDEDWLILHPYEFRHQQK